MTIKARNLIIVFLLLIILSTVCYTGYYYFNNQDEDKNLEANTKINKEYRILINLYERNLKLYIDEELYKTYSVAIGKPSTKTPVGEWAIIHKSKDWGGGFGTRWLGLNVPWGIYGIHGTNKPWAIGGAVSHGCVRMHNSNVEELYDIVPLKTRVKIIGERIPINVNRELRPGETGLAVMQLQDNLRKFGFEPGFMDARYGTDTENAIRELEVQFNLKRDGKADWNVLYLIELPELD